MKRKILFFDIETAPLVSRNWGIYDQNALEVLEEWYILCISYKWSGERKTTVISLPDYKSYKKKPKDDTELLKEMHKVLDEAEVVVAHNGDRFDVKKINARFIRAGLGPVAPYRTVDTLKVARKYFGFTSNKLNDLGRFLDLGVKVQTGGYQLWHDVVEGDMKAWKKMIRYVKQDTVLLEKVYEKFKPWITNHPSVGIMDGRPKSCDNCGSERLHRHDKKTIAKTGWKMQYKCYDCGAYKIGSKLHKFKEKLE